MNIAKRQFLTPTFNLFFLLYYTLTKSSQHLLSSCYMYDSTIPVSSTVQTEQNCEVKYHRTAHLSFYVPFLPLNNLFLPSSPSCSLLYQVLCLFLVRKPADTLHTTYLFSATFLWVLFEITIPKT